MFGNPLLHNTTVSLTIQNFLDRKPPFMYTSRDRAREIRAYDTRWSEFQRFGTLSVTKNWEQHPTDAKGHDPRGSWPFRFR